MSLRELKQNRQANLDKIAEDFKKQAKGQFNSEGYEDDRFWRPAVDKQGNGIATIRFIPAPDGEQSIVKIYRRSFQGPTGKYYINNCLSTLDKPDPVNDLNRKMVGKMKWEQVPEKLKEVIRERKRKTEYISNIYVVDDPINPDNNGKVFLLRYGPQLHGIIMEKMFPTFQGETRINAFDLWGPDAKGEGGGANFKFKIYLKDKKYRNYEKSEFLERAPLFDNDEKLEEVYNQAYSLLPFLAEDQFKPYDYLKKKLDEVLGEGDTAVETPEFAEAEAPSRPESKPAWEGDDEINEDFFNDVDQD